MKFRTQLFTVLAGLATLWSACGLGYTFGGALGSSQLVGLSLFTSLPFILIFSFMAWRNWVGLRNHKVQIESIRTARKSRSMSERLRY